MTGQPTGRFIAIVGPSGVGKDSVMEALVAHNCRFVLARRVITRPSDAGGEAFEGVSEAEFAAQKSVGAFALSWVAHELHYAIPTTVDAQLAAGHDVLANLSRAVLLTAQGRFARLDVINLMADRDMLAARLAARGREDASQIAKRLDQAVKPLPDGVMAHQIDNSGALADTVQAIMAVLYPERA